MTTQTEALKMALEAAYLAGFNASGEGYNGEYPFGDKMQDPAENRVWKKDRDNYIKEALAQPEHHTLTSRVNDVRFHKERDEQRDEAMKMLAQPEQEPVAWMIWTHGSVLVFMKKDEADMEFDRLNQAYPEPTRMLVPLYTTAQQRTWAKLTDDEFAEACRMAERGNYLVAFQYIQTKLKEKNT